VFLLNKAWGELSGGNDDDIMVYSPIDAFDWIEVGVMID
jgi:hypothetical protein